MSLLKELLFLSEVQKKPWTPEQWAKSDLQKYIEKGIIFKDGQVYVGKALDGEEVQVGTVGEEEATEKYLKSRRPQDW